MYTYSLGRKLGSDVDKANLFVVTSKGSYDDGAYKTKVTELNYDEFVNALERIVYLKGIEGGWGDELHELMAIDERMDTEWSFIVPVGPWGEYCNSLKKLDVVYFDLDGTKYDVDVYVDFYSDVWNF